MSQKQHKKQIERARQKRQADAVHAKQRRVRVIAIIVIAAVALSLFAGALLSRGDTGTPEVAGDVGGEGYATETDTPDAANGTASEADTSGASYDSPQGANAEPCPTDVEAPEVTATPRDAAPEMTIDTSATYTATVETTCGTIVIELAAADAPVTVNNFVTLAQDDYYVGVPFHRVIDGFMIQGGDPTGTGTGGNGEFPGYTFEDELTLAQQVTADNGGYPRGTLAMANAGPDTNGSQFFIVQATPGYPLPPDYAVFGHVTEGMDIVDRIAQGPANGDQAIDPVRIIDITIEEQAA